MPVAIFLVLFAVLSRVLPTVDLSLSNLAPFTGIAFSLAVYFRKPWLWVASFLGLELSDLYLNWFHASQYGFHWSLSGFFIRTVCFVLALGIGAWVSRRKSWRWMLNGSLLGDLLFYVITNTQSWMADGFYAKTLAGWWQALTVGHPEFPPTIYFFRNTLLGDLMFTGLFAGAMEWLASRKDEPSLLDNDDEEEDAESEGELAEKPVEAEAEG